MEVRVLFRALSPNHQGVTAAKSASVDMPNNGMNEAGDKMATNSGDASPTVRNKKAGPFHKVKAGSAVVPIYRTESKGRVRFTLSFYRDGRRMRKMFNSLDDAKKEALFVAQRIQSGMQHVTDLKPHERDSFKAAETLLEKLGIPLYAAVEDYVRARTLAGSESLSVMVYCHPLSGWNVLLRGPKRKIRGWERSLPTPDLSCLENGAAGQPLKLWFGCPSSSRSPMRFTASLRIEAAANTITPTFGSTNGMTFRAETNPAIFPTKLRYLSAFMATGCWCQRAWGIVHGHVQSFW